jgi:RNA polymerase sigma-70 factor, ECF subfamily
VTKGSADVHNNGQMTPTNELTEDRLLRRSRAGDEEAFAYLYRQKHPAIYRFALHMSGNAAVADDVTQEVFMTLIREQTKFDPSRGSLGGFLFGIARNHLRKRWEQDRRLVSFEGDADQFEEFASYAAASHGNGHGHPAPASSHDEFTSLETVGRVRQAVSTLPENYREVVILCEFQEMSYEDAAAALGCPVGTVRSRLHRARAILLEKLRVSGTTPRASAVGK